MSDEFQILKSIDNKMSQIIYLLEGISSPKGSKKEDLINYSTVNAGNEDTIIEYVVPQTASKARILGYSFWSANGLNSAEFSILVNGNPITKKNKDYSRNGYNQDSYANLTFIGIELTSGSTLKVVGKNIDVNPQVLSAHLLLWYKIGE